MQRGSLSLMLFSLEISDIEQFCNQRGVTRVNIDDVNEVTMLLYADDLVILADAKIERSANLTF